MTVMDRRDCCTESLVPRCRARQGAWQLGRQDTVPRFLWVFPGPCPRVVTRGPFHRERTRPAGFGAARIIGPISSGLTPVQIGIAFLMLFLTGLVACAGKNGPSLIPEQSHVDYSALLTLPDEPISYHGRIKSILDGAPLCRVPRLLRCPVSAEAVFLRGARSRTSMIS